MDDDAVSPVIGVIMMVAVVVVTASVLFLFASNLADESTQQDIAPQITFLRRDGGLLVQKVPQGVDWADLDVQGTDCVVPTGTVDPGDRIEDCTGEVVIRHKPTNTLVLRTTF